MKKAAMLKYCAVLKIIKIFAEYKVGDLIDFSLWKKKRDIDFHENEIQEIKSLRKELSKYLDDINESVIKNNPQDTRVRKIIQVMIETLNSQKKWPIDSSDM